MAEARPIDYASFLHAYSIGCLDKEDQLIVLKHLEARGEFPWQDLGEFQNLSALLPSFLILDEPPANLKEKVARKLYRLSESKTKKKQLTVEHQAAMPRSSKTKTSLTEKMKNSQIIPASPESAPIEQFIKSDSVEDVIPPEEFKSSSPFSQRSGIGARPPQGTQVKNRNEQEIPNRQQYSAEQESGKVPQQRYIDDSPFKGAAEEEFIINQGFDEPYEVSPSETSADTEMHLNMGGDESLAGHFNSEGNPLPNVDDVYPSAVPSGKPLEHASSDDDTSFENIRKQVVSDVEREEVQPDPVYIPVPNKSSSPAILYVLIILLILGIVGVYYMLNMKISSLQGTGQSKAQFITQEAFESFKKEANSGNSNTELMALLLKKDTKVSILNGFDKYQKSYAKIVFDPKTKSGVISFVDLPTAEKEVKFTLWLVTGVFPAKVDFEMISKGDAFEYGRIKNIEVKDPRSIFVITIDNSEKSLKQKCFEGKIN